MHHHVRFMLARTCYCTLRARNDRTALVRPLLHGAVLTHSLREGTDPQVAHEHPLVARTVQTRLVRHYAVTLLVVLEVVVTSRRSWNQ